jgi:hypothetical protein
LLAAWELYQLLAVSLHVVKLIHKEKAFLPWTNAWNRQAVTSGAYGINFIALLLLLSARITAASRRCARHSCSSNWKNLLHAASWGGYRPYQGSCSAYRVLLHHAEIRKIIELLATWRIANHSAQLFLLHVNNQ